ncbi:hypothetical protein BDR06DRAFT_1012342 [Suillus hirtellus]|nr:hypothetical protein BDR06DRAFT_1012342 [Suillus hirtellus]
MPGTARSIAKKKQMAHAEQEKAYVKAMKEYHDEQKKPESERKSRKAICRDVADKLEGGWICGQFNAEQNVWLSPEEEESVIAYCIELGNQGFPLNHS